jgi:uncharacterized protein
MQNYNFYKIFLSFLLALITTAAANCQTKPKLKKQKATINRAKIQDTVKTTYVLIPQNKIPPRPKKWVTDYEHVFTTFQIDSLNTFLTAYEKRTTNEIVIVVLDTSFTNAITFNEDVVKIAKAWGVGKKNKNNGVLIAFCSNLKKIYIATGTGVQKRLTNTLVKNIIDTDILPAFKQQQYYIGVVNGMSQILHNL